MKRGCHDDMFAKKCMVVKKHGLVDMGGDVDVGGQPNKQQQRGKIEWTNCSNESSSMKYCQRHNGHKGLVLSPK